MNQPVIVWWWILLLTQMNGYIFLILCTLYCDIGRLESGKIWLQAVPHSSGDRSVCHVLMENVYAAGWWSCAVGTCVCVCVCDGGGDFGVTAVRTPHTVHICIHVIMLWIYSNAIKAQLKILVHWLNSAPLHVSMVKGEEYLQSCVNIVYVSIFINYNNIGSDKT